MELLWDEILSGRPTERERRYREARRSNSFTDLMAHLVARCRALGKPLPRCVSEWEDRCFIDGITLEEHRKIWNSESEEGKKKLIQRRNRFLEDAICLAGGDELTDSSPETEVRKATLLPSQYPVMEGGRAAIPVAFYSPERMVDEGLIAWMEIELLRAEGQTGCAVHPATGIALEIDRRLEESIARAWQGTPDVLARWGLKAWRDAEPLPDECFSGESLSAAAARAFTLLLRGQRVDSRILVSARWDGETVCHVEGIPKKVAALCGVVQRADDRSGPEPAGKTFSIDTVAVEGDRNAREARDAVNRAGMTEKISVVQIDRIGLDDQV